MRPLAILWWLPVASLAATAVVSIPAAPFFSYSDVPSDAKFILRPNCSYHIVFHELHEAAVVAFRNSAELKFTAVDLPRFLSVNSMPSIEWFMVTSSQRVSFSVFQVACSGNIIVTNRILARFSVWSDFLDLPCSSKSDVFMFFNTSAPYFLTSGFPGVVIPGGSIDRGETVNASGPSLLSLSDVPCSLQFDVSVESDQVLDGEVVELLIPDQLFPNVHVPPDADDMQNQNKDGLVYGIALSFFVVAMVFLLFLIRALCKNRARRPPPIKKPPGTLPSAPVEEGAEALAVGPEIEIIMDDQSGEARDDEEEPVVAVRIADPYGINPEHCYQGGRAEEAEERPESPYDGAIGLY
jgi:hypothetical protein